MKNEERALNPAKALKMLQETCAGQDWEILRVKDLREIKRREGRRLIVRYDVEVRLADGERETRTLYGKLFRGRGGERLNANLLWLTSRIPPELKIPETLGYNERRRFIVLGELTGPTFAENVAEAQNSERLAAFGCTLAQFHGIDGASAPSLPIHAAPAEIAVLDEARARMADSDLPMALKAEFAPVLAKTQERLRKQSGTNEPPALLHRDLHPGQVLVSDGGFGLLDLDSLSRGEPELDVGNFIAHFWLSDLQCLSRFVHSSEWEAEFLMAYAEVASLRVDPLQTYTVASLLRLASLKRLSRIGALVLNWEAQAAMLLREARRRLHDIPMP